MGVEMAAPNSTFHYENLPELPPGFLYPHPFPNTPIIKILWKNNSVDSLSSL